MRVYFCLVVWLLGVCAGEAQAYFQQHIAYDISVTLDDYRHQLSGQVQIAYTNNSPDTLHRIYIHLYPNAYSSKETAFAKQMTALGDKDFALAEPWELGGMDSLDFSVDDRALPWSLDPQHPDIAILQLPVPLVPGATNRIVSPFRVRIPRSFSRLGRILTSYQVSQWYPKPAVYDQEGWHPMPYLDQGEFYGEFGEFEVEITLPRNYVVAATGTLQTQDEVAWLDSLANAMSVPAMHFPKSAGQMKTLRFTAEDVHDFAWFADKRFAVRRHDAEIGGRTIPCWAFYTGYDQDLWVHAAEYAADAVGFYSEHVGQYPYDQMTVVQAPGSAGRGMEYPMITLLGDVLGAEDLDQVIAHEVGHNWFYGILGSNERAYPWMDEGINTLYEYWYMLDKYDMRGDQLMIRIFGREENTSDPQRLLQYLYQIGRPVSPGDAPTDQNILEYTLSAYYKPALAFWMLSDYLGPERYRQAMHRYFARWKFRHPQPKDVFAVFEESCNCDLAWLERLVTTGALPDYKLVSADVEAGTLTLTNQGELPAPVGIFGSVDDGTASVMWLHGFRGDTTVHFGLENMTSVQLYKPAYSLDASPGDNMLYLTPSPRRGRKPEIRLFAGVPNTGRIPVNVLPVGGWNDYDKGMLGVALSNVQWPPSRMRWAAVPLFATNTSTLTGMALLEHRTGLHAGFLETIEVGGRVKSFHYDHDRHYGFFDRYLKVQLAANGNIRRNAPLSTIRQELGLRTVNVRQRFGRGVNFSEGIWERVKRDSWIHEVHYTRRDLNVLAPSELSLVAQTGKGFVRLSGDFDQKLAFREADKGLYLHAFAGWLPYLKNPDANVLFHFNGISSVGSGARDYTYDELLFARNTVDGFLGQQVFLKDARLKTLDSSGLSDSWMISAGLSTDTPLSIPVQPYFDITAYSDPVDGGMAVSYSGGLAIVLKKNVFEVYFPLLESKDIRTSLTYVDRKSVFQRMSILLDLTALNPFDLVDRRLEP